MKEYTLSVDFKTNPIYGEEITLVQNDYNSTKFNFLFDSIYDNYTKVFELKYPSGKKWIKEIIDDVKSGINEKINEVKLEFASYKASTNEQIKELTREVRKHNNFAERMPVVENEIEHIEQRITELHRND